MKPKKPADAKAWMPLYVSDWDNDTAHLSCAEDGAYGRLIRFYWRNGPPPDDDGALARIVREGMPTWKKMRPVLAPFFVIVDGRWRHRRVEAEREHADSLVEKRSDAGMAGATSKWGSSDGDKKRSERLASARALARHSPAQWEALKAVCGLRCVRCGSDDRIVKDHIQPIYQGGSDGIDNLQPLCARCNSSKGADATDHRPSGWRDAYERLAERLANAWQTPGGKPAPSPTHPPSVESSQGEGKLQGLVVGTGEVVEFGRRRGA